MLQGQIKAVIISHSHVEHFGGGEAVCGYNLVNLKNDRYQAFDIVTPHDREFLTRSGKRVDLREETKACIRMLEGHLKSISGFSKAAKELGINADTLYGWNKRAIDARLGLGLRNL